jgi:hypothetical protein
MNNNNNNKLAAPATFEQAASPDGRYFSGSLFALVNSLLHMHKASNQGDIRPLNNISGNPHIGSKAKTHHR